jgi:hypothetical protein
MTPGICSAMRHFAVSIVHGRVFSCGEVSACRSAIAKYDVLGAFIHAESAPRWFPRCGDDAVGVIAENRRDDIGWTTRTLVGVTTKEESSNYI